MKKLLSGILLFAFSALSLFAQDLSGSWTVKAQIGNRDGTMQLTLTQRSNLSGKVSAGPREYPIEKGSVDSAGIIDIRLGGDKGKLAEAKITGTVDGDRLRLTIQTKKGRGEGIASRSQSWGSGSGSR
jgi:hypothetical protein